MSSLYSNCNIERKQHISEKKCLDLHTVSSNDQRVFLHATRRTSAVKRDAPSFWSFCISCCIDCSGLLLLLLLLLLSLFPLKGAGDIALHSIARMRRKRRSCCGFASSSNRSSSSSRAPLLLHLLSLLVLLCFPCSSLATTETPSLVYAMISKSLNNPFFEHAHKACMEQAGKLGAECLVLSPQEEDSSGVVQAQVIDDIIKANLKQLSTRPIAGIAVAVTNVATVGPAIDRAVQAGIPVVTFDSDAPTSQRAAYVGTNNYFFGRQIAKRCNNYNLKEEPMQYLQRFIHQIFKNDTRALSTKLLRRETCGNRLQRQISKAT